MGLLDILFGKDNDDPPPWKDGAGDGHDQDTPEHYTEYEGGYTGIKFDQYFFIDDFSDEESINQNLGEYRLIIGPHPEHDGFAVHRCNEAIYIPEGSCLYITNAGDLIDVGGKPFSSAIAQLVHPDDIDPSEDVSHEILPIEGELMEAPEELAGKNIPEGDKIPEEDLEMLSLPFATR